MAGLDSLCGEDIANKDLLDVLGLEAGALNGSWGVGQPMAACGLELKVELRWTYP
jgi:hypothetical protein